MSEILLGNIKIREFDCRNWVIETLEEVTDRKTQEEKLEWQIQGYYGNIESALKRMPLKFLKKKDIQTLEDIEKALQNFRIDVINEIRKQK